MKLLIVDDEVLVRVGIRSMLNWADYDCEIVGEASGGVEALELVRKHDPDILLLDITMPGMDGIEVIQRLRSQSNRPVIIVISCHEEFSLVRQALLSGANDYLLKHSLRPENFVAILQQYQAGFRKASSRRETAAASLQTLAQQLLQGGDSCELELRMGENFQCLAVGLLTVEDYAKVTQRYKAKAPGFFRETAMGVLDNLLFFLPRHWIMAVGDDRFCIFVGCDRDTPYNLADVGCKLTQGMRKYLNIEVLVAFSGLNEGPGRFVQAAAQAREAQDIFFFSTINQVVLWKPCQQQELCHRAALLTEQMSHALRQTVRDKNLERFQTLLHQFENSFFELRQIGGSYYKKLLQLIVGDLFVLTLAQRQELAEAIDATQTLAQTTQVLLAGYRRNESSLIPHVDTENYLVKQAVQYLLENYTSDITLEGIAAHLHVSESYISRLFKSELKTNIFKFLNAIRIEQAKKILRDPTLKPYQVAEMVGFHNRIYFDNVFKTLEGITPSEYRKDFCT